MMSREPKRVAFFAENALSPIQGGGIVAYAVLQGIPSERLLGFYDYENITPASEYTDRFILLNRWLFLGSLQMLMERVYDVTNKISPILTFWAALYFWFFNSLPLVFFFRVFAKRDFNRVIAEMQQREFTPDLVYFSGLSLRYLTLSVAVARHFDVPMAVLHMDNWMERECKQLGRVLGAIWHKEIVARMKEAAARSLSSTTNSPGLAKVISEMTGYRHEAANNCCSDLLHGKRVPPMPDNPVPVITYAGAMNKNLQGETLITLSHAIAELNAEGVRAKLQIFTPWEFAPIANKITIPGSVEYLGQASRSELAKAYIQSEFLVTTTTFDIEKLTLFRYSLSTKLSEYLCVGRPVISMGHAEWHLHEYVLEHGCGFVITESSLPQIKKQLRKILSTPLTELQYIGNANRALWEQAHDVQIMAKTTRTAIGMGEVSNS